LPLEQEAEATVHCGRIRPAVERRGTDSPGLASTPRCGTSMIEDRHSMSISTHRGTVDDHEPSVLLTELNVPLMLRPRLWTIVTQATTIKASITAYSTAVGPSSLTRNRTVFEAMPNILEPLIATTQEPGWRGAVLSQRTHGLSPACHARSVKRAMSQAVKDVPPAIGIDRRPVPENLQTKVKTPEFATDRPFRPRECARADYEPSELQTVLNVPLMLLPRLVTIVTQATTIKASITAYSTAVGPSSLTRKR